MDNNSLMVGVGFVFVLGLVAGICLVADMMYRRRIAARIIIAVQAPSERLAVGSQIEGSSILRYISEFGMVIAGSGVLSRKAVAELITTLESAGFKGRRGLGLFIGAKILLTVLMPFCVVFFLRNIGHGGLFLILKLCGGAVVGMLAPEMIVNKIRKSHLTRVEAGVPDALDMLVICADAGLALEASLARVSEEMVLLNPSLSRELTQTSRELQIGTDMRKAMENLGQRTGLVTLRRLATTLSQSLQYGTPLTQTLRSLSAELRQEALVKFEERAGKLPTLMTVPMIVFILPCVFLIVAGPAMINVLATMHHMK